MAGIDPQSPEPADWWRSKKFASFCIFIVATKTEESTGDRVPSQSFYINEAWGSRAPESANVATPRSSPGQWPITHPDPKRHMRQPGRESLGDRVRRKLARRPKRGGEIALPYLGEV